MAGETNEERQLKIAHVLFIDIVGYSKLLTDQQRELLRLLNEVVRTTEQFRAAELADQLVRLPTGDGMALAFFNSPDAPVRCAMEIDQRLKEYPQLNVRMGIHSGPVDVVHDVNDRTNVAGAGINMAQRVMDCADAGHILLSKRVADDLAQYERWQPHLYDLGVCEVKHGVEIELVNLYDSQAGNPEPPEKFKRKHEAHAAMVSRAAVGRRRKLVLATVAAIAVATAAVAAWFWFGSDALQTRSARLAAQSANSVAILPFKPIVAEASDPVLEMGMADSLITQLSGSGDVIVLSLTSVRSYGGLDQDPLDAGRRLGVQSVLEGTVQKLGDRLRVSVRLLRVSDGASLLSEEFRERFTDVFAVQETISQKIAEALALRLKPEGQRRLTKRYTDNVAAYQLYLTGRFHWNKFTPPEQEKSIGYFEQAVQIDPNYALAYHGLAAAYIALGMTGVRPSTEMFPKAKDAAIRAIQIDSALAEAHATLSLIHMFFDWDWAAAEREGRHAISLDPNLGSAHLALAQVLSLKGRHPEALRAAAIGRELDRVSLLNNSREGALLYLARHFDEADQRLQRTLELDPNFWIAHTYRGKVFLEQGKITEAIAAFNQAIESSRGNPEPLAALGYLYGRTGNGAKAQEVLAQLHEIAVQRGVAPYHFALVHTGLVEQDEALAWLEKAVEERDPRVSWLQVEPSWDSLRGDARFAEILRRVGF
ncbi:adenylate/guanylate cyclase domain-containing protein [soil metagenome]